MRDKPRCEVCGEPYEPDDETGEFWDPINDCPVIAHVQCGIEAALDQA